MEKDIGKAKEKYQSGDLDILTPFYPHISAYLKDKYAGGFSLLDLGCGIRLRFERKLIRDFPNVRLLGVDLNTPDRIPSGMVFCQWDVQKKRLLEGSPFDVVYFSELIEHMDDGDGLLDNCYANCKKGGYLICTIPNLASLFGRVELLMGLQPHVLEASNRYPNVGTGYFGKLNNPGSVSIHHIRGLTYKAMCEMIIRHGFRIIETKGHFRQKILRPLAAVKPLAADILIIAKK